MIIDFERKTICERVVSYNENKVEKGAGERILNETFGRNRNEISEELNDVVSLNGKVYRNRFVHGFISLAPGESVADDKFIEIYKDWSRLMGYENCPSVLYRHFDGNNEHIHFVSTSIDYAGEKVKEWNDIERNIDACRHLEKTHDLTVVTARDSAVKVNLSEINAKKHSILEGLMKCNRSELLQEGVFDILGKDSLEIIKTKRMDNKSIETFIGQDKMNDIKGYLNERGLIWSCYKDGFINDLNNIFSRSNSMDEFLLNTQKHNYYVRKLFDIKGKPFLQYGFPIGEKHHYLKENRMPDVFRYANLKNLEPGIDLLVVEKLSSNDQKKALKSIIDRALKTSSNIQEFESTLIKQQIYLKTHSNSGGIYGVSFGFDDLKEFKGSDISTQFSWSKIENKLSANSEKELPLTSVEGQVDKVKSVNSQQPRLHSDESDIELFKKKKRKKQDREDPQR